MPDCKLLVKLEKLGFKRENVNVEGPNIKELRAGGSWVKRAHYWNFCGLIFRLVLLHVTPLMTKVHIEDVAAKICG